MARFTRAVAYLLSGKGDVVDGARGVLALREGWQDELSVYAILIGHFGARRAHRPDEARKFLDATASKCRASAWPFPVLRFLRGERD
jgi:hypothetical protein